MQAKELAVGEYCKYRGNFYLVKKVLHNGVQLRMVCGHVDGPTTPIIEFRAQVSRVTAAEIQRHKSHGGWEG